MHYSIIWPDDDGERQTLEAALDWLGEREELQLELERYETVCCTPELLIQIAKTPIDFLDAEPSFAVSNVAAAKPAAKPEPERYVSRDPRRTEVQPPSHNELEEFLL
jgi:hypothetical protein